MRETGKKRDGKGETERGGPRGREEKLGRVKKRRGREWTEIEVNEWAGKGWMTGERMRN